MRKWHEISERLSNLPASEFDEILKTAVQDKSVISLGPGEPDFTIPKHIKNYIKKLLDKGFTHYAPPAGFDEVREAIAKKLRKENKIDVNLENIIVTSGSTEALFLAFQATLDPGEAVAIPNPGFVDYIPMVEILTGIPQYIQLRMEDNFELDPELLAKTIDERTRVLVINTPANPTGTVYKKKILEEIADIAVEKDLLIFSDEAYEKFVYDGAKHISIASLNGLQDRVVTFNTFSKTYAMTGFRVGYAAGPEKLIRAMIRLHMYTTLCAAPFSQLAAKFALESTQKFVKEMVKEFARRRKLVLKRLEKIPGMHFVKPHGAFYVFPKITEFGMSSTEFAHFILKKAKVLVVPGNEFGKYGEGFVRISYATNYEKIEIAMNRIEEVLKKHLKNI
jgi:aminotransferase